MLTAIAAGFVFLGWALLYTTAPGLGLIVLVGGILLTAYLGVVELSEFLRPAIEARGKRQEAERRRRLGYGP